MKIVATFLLIACSLCVGVGQVCAQLPIQASVIDKEIPLIPRETFFSQNSHMSVKISPNGEKISFIAPYEGVPNIWITSEDKNLKAYPVTKFKDRPIANYVWTKNNEQLLIFRDFKGDENFHIFTVDLKTLKMKDITPFEHIHAQLVRQSEKYPNDIIVAINNRDPEYHDLWTINTRSGKRKCVFKNDEKFSQLYVDDDLVVCMGKKNDDKGGSVIFSRNLKDGSWKEFCHFAFEDSMTSDIIGFSSDNQQVYFLDSSNSNTNVLYCAYIDAARGQKEKVFCDDTCDILDVFHDPKTKKPRAISSEFSRVRWTILDPDIQKDMEYLQNLTPGDLYILDNSLDDQKWLITYVYDNKPPCYYLYDRNKKIASFLFSSNQTLENLPLTSMQPVVITSRDGLPLVSYLSLPRQGPQKNIPMVLLVHGGPWSRDIWGYNAMHQWLNNRGYAVLSVNFRGSTGFGKAFVNGATREWSKKMHDDLIDAVSWSISQGIADSKKIAIAGVSYGGYATLVGLTFTPNVFACGVDICGPSNLQTMLENFPPYWKSEMIGLQRRIGSLTEPEFLHAASPLYKVDKICKPLLIGQGKNDPRVIEQESSQIVNAMKKNQKAVMYILFPDEGHGFRRPENKLAFYAVMETFLSKELGGRCQKIGDALQKSSAVIVEGEEIILKCK